MDKGTCHIAIAVDSIFSDNMLGIIQINGRVKIHDVRSQQVTFKTIRDSQRLAIEISSHRPGIKDACPTIFANYVLKKRGNPSCYVGNWVCCVILNTPEFDAWQFVQLSHKAHFTKQWGEFQRLSSRAPEPIEWL